MILLQLLVLLSILSIAQSFVRVENRFASFAIFFFLALIFTVQLSSIVIIGEVANYRFYENFNLSDTFSVAGFFRKESILISGALILCTMLMYYIQYFLGNRMKKRPVTIAIFFFGIGILSIPNGIIYNLYHTASLKLTGNNSFNEALSSLQIDQVNYVT